MPTDDDIQVENIDTNEPDEEKIDSEDTTGDDTTPEPPEEESVDPDKLTIETRGRGEDTIDYGDEIDPDDIKTIGKIVEKQTEGVKKSLQDTQDRIEVDSFVSEHPEFSKYKPVIMKYIKHPVYSKIPVGNIAAMVASKDLMKLGAEKERKAQEKADSTKTTGNQVRKEAEGAVDWNKVSKDDFEMQKRRVLGQSD